MRRLFSIALILGLLAWPSLHAASPPAFEDSMAQRTLACTACHGKQGRAGPDGYYPRLAGKPAGYLYNQLLNFRDGRRHYGLMASLVEPLSDAYLMEIAQYFSMLDLPYPAPAPTTAAQQVLARGRILVTQGDTVKKIPACVQCHGEALTGVAPNIPGLLGLPRDYLNAQLGGWQTRQRRAAAPDCMAHIADQLSDQDVASVAHWLASQPVPANAKPLSALPPLRLNAPRISCGSVDLPIASGPIVASPSGPASDLVTQGAYLARAGNCQACHTVPGGPPYGGGRGIATPFGTVFSSNLTSDKTTGIGAWSSSEFWEAMHNGRSRDGRLLYPAFPYTSFTQITRADSDALYAYLKTVAPTKQANAVHALRWPYSTQAALAVWRAIYFSPGVYRANASQTADWNRGAYLVNGLGHCGACHTPRNTLGASQEKLDLDGGMLPMQNWYAPSLKSGLEASVADWTSQDIVALLKTGTSSHGLANGPMAEVVLNSTQFMSANDLMAMSVFLKSLAPTAADLRSSPASTEARTGPAGTSTAVPGKGAKLYENHCAQCHGNQGDGVRDAYPPLRNNRTVTMANPSNLVQIVLHGGFAPATAGNPRPYGMPPFVLQLSDPDLATLLTYVRSSWGNHAPKITELDVNRARTQP